MDSFENPNLAECFLIKLMSLTSYIKKEIKEFTSYDSVSSCHTESQNGRGWKGPLWVAKHFNNYFLSTVLL